MIAPFCYRFTIRGRVRSKKNGKRILRGRGGSPFLGSSAEFLAWEDDAITQLLVQGARSCRVARGVPVRVSLRVYLAKGQRFDRDNARAGVFDVLQKAGVIANDHQIRDDPLWLERDPVDPRVEVEVKGPLK